MAKEMTRDGLEEMIRAMRDDADALDDLSETMPWFFECSKVRLYGEENYNAEKTEQDAGEWAKMLKRAAVVVRKSAEFVERKIDAIVAAEGAGA